MSVIQTVEIGIEDAINIIDTFLPVVEKIVPAAAAAAGPVGLGVSAASVLLPLLAKIPIGPEFTVEDQASYLSRIQAVSLLDFSSPVWKPSTAASGGPSVASASVQAS